MENPAIYPNLLEFTPAGGCGCKLPLRQMREYLASVDALLTVGHKNPGTVVDGTDRDDAALYEITPGVLLAITTDFGTPVSANVATWGRIAAQNALSDVYAMGASPLLALSVMAVPDSFGVDFLTQLTDGAVTALRDAGAPLVGGHTVRSPMPLFGLSVVGQVPADRAILLRNARPGHRLILTKPLGTGVVVAAAKEGSAPSELVKASEDVMSRSNRVAAEIAAAHGVVAGTDISGFGLIGHLQNMMAASGCSARLRWDAVPVIPGVEQLLDEHAVVPNSAEGNLFAVEDFVEWVATPYRWRLILCDPQTSGGLLLAVDPAVSSGFLAACAANNVGAQDIGSVGDAPAGSVVVEP